LSHVRKGDFVAGIHKLEVCYYGHWRRGYSNDIDGSVSLPSA